MKLEKPERESGGNESESCSILWWLNEVELTVGIAMLVPTMQV